MPWDLAVWRDDLHICVISRLRARENSRVEIFQCCVSETSKRHQLGETLVHEGACSNGRQVVDVHGASDGWAASAAVRRFVILALRNIQALNVLLKFGGQVREANTVIAN